MNTPDTRLSLMPYVAGGLSILALLLVGMSAPVFTQMYRDFGISPLPPRLKVVSVIHWWWTLPLGFGVALVLAWGRKQWCLRTNRMVGTFIIVLSVAVFLAFTASVLTVC